MIKALRLSTLRFARFCRVFRTISYFKHQTPFL